MSLRPPRQLGIPSAEKLFQLSTPVLYAALLFQALLDSDRPDFSIARPASLAALLLLFLFTIALTRYLKPERIGTNSRAAGIELLGVLTSVMVSAWAQADFGSALPFLILTSALFPLMLSTETVFAFVFLAAAGAASAAVAGGDSSYDNAAFNVAAVLCTGLFAIFLARVLTLYAAAVRQAHTNDRRFHAIAGATRNIFMIADANYRIKYANPALHDVIGYTQEEIEQDNVWPTIHPDDVSDHQEKLRFLRGKPHGKIFSRHRSQHRDGRWIWLETRAYNMLHDPAINGLVFSVEDITARKEAERKLEAEHALLRAVLDLNPSMIYAKDTAGRFMISNTSFQRRFGYASEEDLRGRTVHDLVFAQLGSGREKHAARIADASHSQDMEVIRCGDALEELETQGLWEGDERRWYRSNKYPLRDADDCVVGMLGITRDITERKEYELRLEHQAQHDFLTGLPNRRYLLKKINEQIISSQGIPSRMTVLFCDLDFFKSVNDTHGHDIGDKCLAELAQRIRMALPETDFVCRYGGDEFVIFTHASLQDATIKARHLISVL
jgi:PAS domain S-box-containing protein